jgi:hypothetical protein
MPQSRTLSIGWDVHQESIARAYVAQEHHADVVSLGTIGARPGALDQLIRQMPSKSKPLLLVSAAGPCGYGLSRSLCPKQAMSAGSWRPPGAPQSPGIGSTRTVVLPSNWPV